MEKKVCNRLVFTGLLLDGERCGLPEEDEMHDPLGPVGRHVFDPAPLLEDYGKEED